MFKHLISLSVGIMMFAMTMMASPAFAQQSDEALASIKFNPTQITGQQFLDMMNKQKDPAQAGMALLWIQGYIAGAVGYEKTGPLTPQSFQSLVTFLMYYCQENPKASLLDAANAQVKMKQ